MKVDLERLLAPISGTRPSGEPLRYAGLYDQVQEARREDDPTLPQGVWKTELKKADWPEVERLCQEALETRTKDLQLAVWLLEAWLHLDGAAGVTQGLRLLGGLCESFWDSLHPDVEEGDAEARLAPLWWLDERLSEKVRQHIQVTSPGTDEAPAYTLADWESACHLENLARTNPAVLKAADGDPAKVTPPKFLASVSLTPVSFYTVLHTGVRQALEAAGALGVLLEGRCGAQAPGFRRFTASLGAIQQMAQRILEEKPRETAEPEEEDEDMAMPLWADDRGEEPEPASAGGPIRSRAEAYRRLAEAADFLMRSEPHSPVPYLVKRAVGWGSLSLSELLQELLRDGSELNALYSLLGIKGVAIER